MRITWKYEREFFPSRLSLEQKVEIFFEQTWGWQLRIADLMANGGVPVGGGARVGPIVHSGFAVLQVCVSYFETIGQCLAVGSSRACFRAGVLDVFPTLVHLDDTVSSSLLEQLYVDTRCGLYHSSRTRRGVGLGTLPDGVAIACDPTGPALIISPEHLPPALISHLKSFRRRILAESNAALRAGFERWFDGDSG